MPEPKGLDGHGGPSVDVGSRVRWEGDVRGKVLVIDSSATRRDEAYALFYACQREFAGQPADSVRLLMRLENAFYDSALVRLWKGAAVDNNRVVVRWAFTGLSGGVKAALAAYRFYTKMRGIDLDSKIKYFDDDAQARIWLAEP